MPGKVSLEPDRPRLQGHLDRAGVGSRLAAADDLGQAPVDDQRLAIRAEQDVGRLQVAVDYTSAVGVGHHVAHGHEPVQELPQGQVPLPRVATVAFLGLVEAIDRLLEGLPLDESHGVVGAALGVAAQAVDGHDARVLEPSGDLGFEQEAGAAVRVVGAFGAAAP